MKNLVADDLDKVIPQQSVTWRIQTIIFRHPRFPFEIGSGRLQSDFSLAVFHLSILFSYV